MEATPDDFRVLDLSDIKGLLCGRVLAALGGDVIRVERPGAVRGKEPGRCCRDDEVGKPGVALDVESFRGRESLVRLVRLSDVLIESYPPGYLGRLGLGYADLRQANPRIVMASITGFGQDGPWKDNPTCDLVSAALGGQMYLSGAGDTPPLKPFGLQAHNLASLYTVSGVLLALSQRRATGAGQLIDISIHECVASCLDHALVRYFHDGTVAGRTGSRHWDDGFDIFPCRDGDVFLSLFLGWDTLLELMDSEGRAADLKDARWQDSAERHRHIEHVVDIISKWTAGHSASEIAELGQMMRLPWAKVARVEDVLSGPQLAARGFFAPAGGGVSDGGPSYPRLPWLSTGPAKGAVEPALPVAEALRTSAVLEGVRVLDFSRVLAGPFATRMLADFGAEVVKVGYPGQVEEEVRGRSYYDAWNRNKRSVFVDLNLSEGREIIRRLVRMSDVVVENFSPRVMANWGLDYAGLSAVRPGIVFLSLSAFGHTGPYRDRVGFGGTIQAASGLTYLSGLPDRRPLGLGFALADHVAGLFGVIALLAALESRRSVGRGQFLDLSQYEAMLALLGSEVLGTLDCAETFPRGNCCRTASPYGAYRCRGGDRWCALAVFTGAEWESLCRVVNASWCGDGRFASLQGRLENASELDRLVESWTVGRGAGEAMTQLQSVGVSAGIVQSTADLAGDPQLRAREFFVSVGGTTMDANPVRLSSAAARCFRPAPRPGEHTSDVLQGLLGLSAGEVARYRKRGVIG
ncbi:MAG: CoA transferase [Chloroflexota bacterium]